MKRNLFAIALIALVAGLTSCKDGDPGPGFTEAIKYGNISTTFSGKRPTDSVEFKASLNFKYSPVGNSVSNFSTVYTDPNTESKYFYIERYFSGVDTHYDDNYFEVDLQMSKTGDLEYVYLSDYATIIDGTKYFGVSDSWEQGKDDTTKPISISDYSFDSKTGHLKFKFAWIHAKGYSSTGYEQTINGIVDVFVFESLQNNL